MDFKDLMSDPSTKDDLQRLIQLCNSYGLNEEETNQIISDFKNGSFACHDQSLDQSFQQSLKGIDSRREHNHFYSKSEQDYIGSVVYQESDSKHTGQEYSFKTYQHKQLIRESEYQNQNRNPSRNNNSSINNDSLEKSNQYIPQSFREPLNNSNNKKHRHNYSNPIQQYKNGSQSCCENNSGISTTELYSGLGQLILSSTKQFQHTVKKQLQQQNEFLKQQLSKKEQKIDLFMKMKVHDSDVILGLKDSIAELTKHLMSKEQNYQNLNKKYSKLKQDYEELTWTLKSSKFQGSKKMSSSQLKHHDSTQSQEGLQSSIMRESKGANFGLAVSRQYKVEKKQSQKYLRQSSTRNLRDLSVSRTSKRNDQVPLQPSNQNKQNIELIERQKPQKKDNNRFEHDFKGIPNNKKSGIDIGKYKGMIQKLRSSYEIR